MADDKKYDGKTPATLRSRAWFDNPSNPDMTALYLERYLNFGLTREELQSGKPIIGIAQTGSDLSPKMEGCGTVRCAQGRLHVRAVGASGRLAESPWFL